MDARESRPAEELDQEWSELVEELRLAIPGVEVLFGFLLVLPFQAAFADLIPFQRYVYFAALVSAAVATVLLISPSVNHRLRWRQGDKEALLQYATRMSIAATVFIAFAMTAAVYLITEVMFASTVARVVTGVIAALFAWFWYGLPLWIRYVRNGAGASSGRAAACAGRARRAAPTRRGCRGPSARAAARRRGRARARGSR